MRLEIYYYAGDMLLPFLSIELLKWCLAAVKGWKRANKLNLSPDRMKVTKHGDSRNQLKTSVKLPVKLAEETPFALFWYALKTWCPRQSPRPPWWG